jgi:predicted nucleic acid-binding protein
MSGGGSVLKAVADAGPLIHLSEIGMVNLLGQFSPLLVPESVLDEAISFAPPPDLVFKLVQVQESSRSSLKARLTLKLQAGEIDALAICGENPDAVLLTDDLKARREAKRLGWQVHGSVGIIVRALRVQLLSRDAAERALRNLGECHSLFIAKAVIDEALDELRRP